MSAIRFRVRNLGKYIDVQMICDGTTIDIGVLDGDEAQLLARDLRDAADDIERDGKKLSHD